MRIRNIVFGLITLCIVIVSCVPKRTEKEDRLVRINRYSSNRIYATDTIYLHKEIINDTLKFIYKTGQYTIISFCKPFYNDSLILIRNVQCPLVDNKTFVINNREYIVSKYNYDIEGFSDEETSYFYHSDYGLLVVLNGGWKSLIFSMEYDTISKVLIDSIIINRFNFNNRQVHFVPPKFKNSILLKMKRKKNTIKNACC